MHIKGTKKSNTVKSQFSLGYNLSNAGCDNCKKRQEGAEGIELKISHSCNPNTQKKDGKWKLDAPTVIEVKKHQYTFVNKN